MPIFLWLPYVLVAAVAALLVLSGHPDAGWVVGYGGTLLVVLGLLVYAMIDSRTRWPGVGGIDRLARIITFYRE